MYNYEAEQIFVKGKRRFLSTTLHHLDRGLVVLFNDDESAVYFQSHAARIRYADFRDEGFPIGSGTVKSEVK